MTSPADSGGASVVVDLKSAQQRLLLYRSTALGAALECSICKLPLVAARCFLGAGCARHPACYWCIRTYAERAGEVAFQAGTAPFLVRQSRRPVFRPHNLATGRGEKSDIGTGDEGVDVGMGSETRTGADTGTGAGTGTGTDTETETDTEVWEEEGEGEEEEAEEEAAPTGRELYSRLVSGSGGKLLPCLACGEPGGLFSPYLRDLSRPVPSNLAGAIYTEDPRVLVPCGGCGALLRPAALDQHVDTCRPLVWDCPQCGEAAAFSSTGSGSGGSGGGAAHHTQCSALFWKCPPCGRILQKRRGAAILAHQRLFCPERRTECTYCRAQMPRRHLEEHQTPDHCPLLLTRRLLKHLSEPSRPLLLAMLRAFESTHLPAAPATMVDDPPPSLTS